MAFWLLKGGNQMRVSQSWKAIWLIMTIISFIFILLIPIWYSTTTDYVDLRYDRSVIKQSCNMTDPIFKTFTWSVNLYLSKSPNLYEFNSVQYEYTDKCISLSPIHVLVMCWLIRVVGRWLIEKTVGVSNNSWGPDRTGFSIDTYIIFNSSALRTAARRVWTESLP